MRNHLILVLLLMVMFAYQNCAEPLHSKALSSEAGGNDLSTNTPGEQKALEILAVNCTSCHGGFASGQLANILDVQHLVQDGFVVPGDPNNSPLIQKVESGEMPMGSTLSDSDKAALSYWVANMKNGSVSATPTPTPINTGGAGNGDPGPGVGPTASPTPRPSATPRPSPSATPRPTASPTPPPASGLTATFSSISANILSPRCVSCHGPSVAKKGYRFDSYGYAMSAVTAGAPDSSKLYTTTKSGSMPANSTPRLTAAELKAISDWITAGAPNN